jgi:hypothetical protein
MQFENADDPAAFTFPGLERKLLECEIAAT